MVAKTGTQAMVLNAGRGYYSTITEQTGRDIRDTLVPAFQELINPDLYHLKSLGTNIWDVHWITGHVTRLRSRQAKTHVTDPPFRGPTSCFVAHDEIARDRAPLREELDPILISEAMIRGQSGRVQAMDFTTTTATGWFHEHIKGFGIGANDAPAQYGPRAAGFYEKTRDVDPALYDRLLPRYSPDLAAQELDARWVPLEGRVWRSFLDAPWPTGNTGHWSGWNDSTPWALGVDLGGAESAWLVAQLVPAVMRDGTRVFAGDVIVVMAEFIVSQMGSFKALQEIKQRYGRKYAPFKVCVGHDVGSPGNTIPARNDFVEHGWDHDIWTPRGWAFARRAQHQVCSTILLDTRGQRRFALSKDFRSYYFTGEQEVEPGHRGLREMFDGYTWPQAGTSTSYFMDDKKGARLCDVNDAFTYLVTGLKGSQFYVRTDRHAG